MEKQGQTGWNASCTYIAIHASAVPPVFLPFSHHIRSPAPIHHQYKTRGFPSHRADHFLLLNNSHECLTIGAGAGRICVPSSGTECRSSVLWTWHKIYSLFNKKHEVNKGMINAMCTNTAEK